MWLSVVLGYLHTASCQAPVGKPGCKWAASASEGSHTATEAAAQFSKLARREQGGPMPATYPSCRLLGTKLGQVRGYKAWHMRIAESGMAALRGQLEALKGAVLWWLQNFVFQT